ncbi:DUF1697 domain-containing protein [Lactobacillus sp. YT155]|uniref:DUF1697 domain-containing protein n=1 Tax=Lactobacillus sp. YT155 TaxID=3060955 RepID=UPI00266007B1|nr:DUF1697 domain-containing protein [Lactobacillus sp. YT155]MDO1604643.1 DUF1697 domain-containing protein [Lactobacillus sp. YT155]
MTKYIVLLRGINVGGKNKVPMAELKEVLATKFENVSTYLNTGNIILESTYPEKEIQQLVHDVILQEFDCDVLAHCISANDYLEMMENLPEWFGVNKEDKNNLIFVIAPYTGEKMIAEIGKGKPEFEQVDYFKNFIFWTAPLKTFSRSRWSKIVGTEQYQYITIRNFNTTKKIAELIQNK